MPHNTSLSNTRLMKNNYLRTIKIKHVTKVFKNDFITITEIITLQKNTELV